MPPQYPSTSSTGGGCTDPATDGNAGANSNRTSTIHCRIERMADAPACKVQIFGPWVGTHYRAGPKRHVGMAPRWRPECRRGHWQPSRPPADPPPARSPPSACDCPHPLLELAVPLRPGRKAVQEGIQRADFLVAEVAGYAHRHVVGLGLPVARGHTVTQRGAEIGFAPAGETARVGRQVRGVRPVGWRASNMATGEILVVAA